MWAVRPWTMPVMRKKTPAVIELKARNMLNTKARRSFPVTIGIEGLTLGEMRARLKEKSTTAK